jgi:hypothetical protein
MTKHYFSEMPVKPMRLPRERFLKFYQDLFALMKLNEPDIESFKRGDQYTYSELGDAILEKCEKDGILLNLNLLIFCYWAPEFDPDHSAGAYFCERYRISGKMMDVCDQGIIAAITGLKIIKAYFNQGLIKNALLICMNQTTIPMPKNEYLSLTGNSSAIGLFMESEK